MNEQTPQDFMKNLLGAAPVEDLKEDTTITVPEVKAALQQRLPEIFIPQPFQLIADNPIAGPVAIGLVMAKVAIDAGGMPALRALIMNSAEKVINVDKL